MARRERGHPEWQAMITEYQVLKRKLQSKSQALLIISKDLDTARNERDQFKLMAEKLQERCQAFKRQQAEFPVTSDKAKLLQVLKETKNQKLQYQKQCEQLTQKLTEATGDIKLLREKFARKTVGDEGIGARHFPAHERETLVAELEESQQQCEHWRREYDTQVDVAAEAETEQDALRQKVERLNQELSYVLTGDKKRIIDVDALCMENKYLQDRITQCQEEKNSLHAQINKYKAILSARKSSKPDLLKPGNLRAAGVVVSPKQLKQMLANGSGHRAPQQVADLQSIISALLETINDKNLALHHLRNTNKILGTRVSDLEDKLKTLEVAGLWNLQSSAATRVTNGIHSVREETSADRDSDVRSENTPVGVAPEPDSQRDQFLNSLGSRLSRLTDQQQRDTSDTCRLISLNSSHSSGASDVLASDDAPKSDDDDVSEVGDHAAEGVSCEDIDNWLQNACNHNHGADQTPGDGDALSDPDEDVTVVNENDNVTSVTGFDDVTPADERKLGVVDNWEVVESILKRSES